MRGSKIAIAFFCLAPLTITTAQADPTILDRDRSDRQAPAKRLIPPDAPRPKPPEQKTQVAPLRPFVLRNVAVEGSSLNDDVLVDATSRFVGTSMDQSSIDALAKEISAAYVQSDIALYSIFVPNQTGEGGVLRIVVVEGKIDEVLVSGDADHGDLVYAQKILAPVINETPLRRSTLERALALLGAVPGGKAKSQFLTTNQRGVVKLAVALETSPFEAGVGIATRGSAELGRTQLQANVTANALLQAGDRTTLSFGTPLDFERFRYYGLAHQTPLNADGLTLAGNAAYLTTRPRNSAIRGKAAIAGVQVSYPVILSFTRALSIGLGFDGLNSDNAFLGESVSSDRTRALRLSASYVRLVDETRLTAALSLSQGVDGLGARTSVPALTDLSFLKLSAQAEYDRPILLKSLVLRLGASGQISGDKLPSSEQASLGGESFGRAFDSAIATGDNSIAGSAELAYLFSDLPTPLSTPEVYIFADAGHVWRAQRGVIDDSDTGLASAGIGARVTLFSNVALGLELARALDNPDTDPGDKEWRAIFSFSTAIGR